MATNLDKMSDAQIIGTSTLRTRKGSGIYQTGRDRVAQIQSVALDILIEKGYESLSLREVARRCKIQIGAVSHYYKSRSDLLRDVLQAVLAPYGQKFREIEQSKDLNAEQKLERIADLLLTDMQRKQTTRLFPHLWQLANHDSFVSKAVDSIYILERQTFSRLIAEINPSLCIEVRETLAVYISSAIAGSTIFVGFEKPWSSQLPLYRAILCKSLVDTVKQASLEQLEQHGWRREDISVEWHEPTILEPYEYRALVDNATISAIKDDAAE